MDFFFTTNKDWLEKWDSFLQETNRGLYNQISAWIKSYEVYGFDYEFLLATQNNKIIGGCGIVIAKFSFFKFYIIPSGPVISLGNDDLIEEFVVKLKNRAKEKKCCYFQISLPYNNDNLNFCDYNLNSVSNTNSYFLGNIGVKFKYVIPLLGFRIVDLVKNNTIEKVVKNYSSNHKRNLNKALQNNFEIKFVTALEEIKECYNCFEMNAQEKGYPLRTFNSIKYTLIEYIDKDYAKIVSCNYNNKIIGALYLMKCGNRLTYINGGVLKEFQHLNVSNFMHNALIEYSLNQGYQSYDLSVGGSKGVVKFKEGFGSDLFLYTQTRHWILKPTTFKLFTLFEKYLKPRKKQIAKILIFLKKNKK